MRQPIICGVDDSDAARDATRVAATLAGALRRELVLVHATPPVGLPETDVAPLGHAVQDNSRRRSRRHLLEERARELALPEPLELRIAIGGAAPVLVEVAAREEAELLVVGTRGLGPLAAALFGSVSSELMSQARCPVVIVPKHARLYAGKVLCAVDTTPAAREVLRVAVEFAKSLDTRVVVAHALPDTLTAGQIPIPEARVAALRNERSRAEAFLAELVAREGLGDDVERRIAVAITAEADALAALADEERASLIVIGACQKGLIPSALSGSVSLELPLVAACPIVVVPPARARRRSAEAETAAPPCSAAS